MDIIEKLERELPIKERALTCGRCKGSYLQYFMVNLDLAKGRPTNLDTVEFMVLNNINTICMRCYTTVVTLAADKVFDRRMNLSGQWGEHNGRTG